MKKVKRGPERQAKADIFLSHSSKDKTLALKLATDLNFCGIDVWLDEWEIRLGGVLSDALGKAMDEARFVGIVISANYNKSVWTKREYQKALAREEREKRVVMLPLILGEVEIPEFLEGKKYVDLREEYYSGLMQIAGVVHGVSDYRISRAIRENPPECVSDIWQLLSSVGFEPFVIFGTDDFDEVLRAGGRRDGENYAYFDPEKVLRDAQVSDHVKSLLRNLFSRPEATGTTLTKSGELRLKTRREVFSPNRVGEEGVTQKISRA